DSVILLHPTIASRWAPGWPIGHRSLGLDRHHVLAGKHIHAVTDVRVDARAALGLPWLQHVIVGRFLVRPGTIAALLTREAQLEGARVAVIDGNMDLDLVRAPQHTGEDEEPVLILVGRGLAPDPERQLLVHQDL